MAYSSVTNPRNFMNTVLYTGNSGTQSITSLDFQPDWCWFKARNNTDTHGVFDSVRGVTKRIIPNNNTAEGTQSNGLTHFLSNGFTVGDAGIVNQGYNYASWNWKAGTSFTNDASSTGIGTIDSTGSVNDTAGFSICTHTGTGSNATIKHGLSTAPKVIITKKTSASGGWQVGHESIGWQNGIYLEDTGASTGDAGAWNSTAPTSSIFYVGTSSFTNQSSATYVSYIFSEKQGYSKFGSYIGNGNANGPFINLGFKPAFIMAKKSSDTGGWQLRDNKRTPTGNLTNNLMYANATSVEQTTDGVDFLSNGWKLRNSAGDSNASGGTYIYMAFAEEPFVASNFNTATAK